MAAAELLLAQARAEASSALLAQREQLVEAADADRQLLIREMQVGGGGGGGGGAGRVGGWLVGWRWLAP